VTYKVNGISCNCCAALDEHYIQSTSRDELFHTQHVAYKQVKKSCKYAWLWCCV